MVSNAFAIYNSSPITYISKVLMAIGIALVNDQCRQLMLKANQTLPGAQRTKAYSSLQQGQTHDVVGHRITAGDPSAWTFTPELGLAYYLF